MVFIQFNCFLLFTLHCIAFQYSKCNMSTLFYSHSFMNSITITIKDMKPLSQAMAEIAFAQYANHANKIEIQEFISFAKVNQSYAVHLNSLLSSSFSSISVKLPSQTSFLRRTMHQFRHSYQLFQQHWVVRMS